jgi:hypothetical protein
MRWVTSSFCADSGCVQAARTPDGHIAVRNSRHPDGASLEFTQAEWRAFVTGCRAGEFDDLTRP